MAVETLIPSGDGTVTGWDDPGGVTTPNLWTLIDDYAGGGAQDSATSRIRSPNTADGSAWFLLTDTSAGFTPATITLVQCKIAAVRNAGGAADDTIGLYVQVVKADESTPLTDEIQVSPNLPISVFTEFTVTLTNPAAGASKADWDGARIKIRQDYTQVSTKDATCRMQVSAAKVDVTWSAALTQPVNDTLSLSDATGKAAAHPVADTAAPADAVGKAAAHPLADSAGTTDQIGKAPRVGAQDSVALADGVPAKAIGHATFETVPVADHVQEALALVLADFVVLADGQARAWHVARTLADVAALADEIAKRPGRVQLESVAIADLVAKTVGLSIPEVAALLDDFAAGTVHAEPGTRTGAVSRVTTGRVT